MRLRIVVADEANARIYDVERRTDLLPGRGILEVIGSLADPAAHLHDRDFKSDRPGRKDDHAALQGGRRGATAHHGVGGDQRPRAREAALFAQRIAERLEQDCSRDTHRQLVLVAEPHFLGLLRQALPAALRELVTDEIHKDLVHEPVDRLQAHLAHLLCPLRNEHIDHGGRVDP